jgi:tetratricopeptide (TPR) repeat protein
VAGGTTLAGLGGGVIEAAALVWDERRTAARETFFGYELALGRHAAAVAGLTALVAEEPLREKPVGQLMDSLHWCGRRSDALHVFADFRTRLARELGLDPGAELRQLHQRILAGDLPAAAQRSLKRGSVAVPRQRLAGRRREMGEMGRLLDRAGGGAGGALVLVGPAGSGKTVLAAAAAAEARDRGFRVLWARPPGGQPGRLVWAQLLRDTDAPAELAAVLMSECAGPLDLDGAARHLVSGSPRLIVIDDIDRGGTAAAEMLSMVAARCAAAPAAIIATAGRPLGLQPELRLGGLSEDELTEALDDDPGPDASHALWLASRGLPGVARELAQELGGLGEHDDPAVYLALIVASTVPFLDVDTNLVRLLEAAAGRARDDRSRARVLARLAYELLGDASAAARRRALADEALRLARGTRDQGVLAEVLDARLHALWDPEGAGDRLAAGSEITDLARAAGDDRRERQGMFWRFVALIELGRVAEAESVLAAFAREAAAAGDAEAAVLVTARQAMLAVLHGRFDLASQLTEEVAETAERAGLPDAETITATLAGSLAMERDTRADVAERNLAIVLARARQLPGHLFEATAARILLHLGRNDAAAAELECILPRALASSGPRWLGVMTDLAVVATTVGDTGAAARIYEALIPYNGRLVVLGGAASAWGAVSHQLGSLSATMGRAGDAVKHFEEAIEFEERIGALPFLAHSLAGLAGALESSGKAGRAAVCRQRSREIAQRTGMSVLLERLGREGSEWSLVRDGDYWLLTAGDEHARLRDVRGLHYLRALLAVPGQDIRALDLVAGGAGLVPSGTGPVLDGPARAAYQRRLDKVTAALAAADRAGNQQAAERAEAERQALVRELRGAAGLGGRDRRFAPEAERARINVTRTLRAAIDRVAVPAPRTAAHLGASVRTGASCCYDPAPGGPDRWHV